jgi:hypothetical protein
LGNVSEGNQSAGLARAATETSSKNIIVNLTSLSNRALKIEEDPSQSMHPETKKPAQSGRFRFWLPSSVPENNGLATNDRCWFSASHGQIDYNCGTRNNPGQLN